MYTYVYNSNHDNNNNNYNDNDNDNTPPELPSPASDCAAFIDRPTCSRVPPGSAYFRTAKGSTHDRKLGQRK